MATSSTPPAMHVLLGELNLLAWEDRDTTGYPRIALTAGGQWAPLSRDRLWQLARDVARLAWQHEVAAGGTPTTAGGQLANVVAAALAGQPLLAGTASLLKTTAVLTYDRALFATMLLDALACHPGRPAPQISLHDVSAATGLDEDETWDYLRREAALLEDIHEQATHDTGLPPPDR